MSRCTSVVGLKSSAFYRKLAFGEHSLLPATLSLDSIVDEPSSERLFGVTLNNDLSWNTHVIFLLKKCKTFLFLLSRIKVVLSFKQRKQSLIMLKFFHILMCVIWCSGTSVNKDNNCITRTTPVRSSQFY